tara:strand:- start:40 stop:447 length:408 start_codon:yes stop_codon:yes gene_type:complete
MAINYGKAFKGNLTPIGDRVLVTDMFFGEQKLKSGLIIRDDNGSTRGIYPRWGKVQSKGPENNEEYNVGDWILIEHGRWTRAVNVDNGDIEYEVRMIDAECVLGWSKEKPDDVLFGKEYRDGEHATVDPQQFVDA